MNTNSNLGSGRCGDLATPKAFASRELFGSSQIRDCADFDKSVIEPEPEFVSSVARLPSISSCAPMFATWAAAYFRKEFPNFCPGSVGKEVLLKAAPVAKEETRCALINDVSRE
jgi:hypothetical protein